MNDRKSQNSIFVLATLGVYLGLVLAGATPQILAQAAMTRYFDVKDEIEFKDDLDNKPARPIAEVGETSPTEVDQKAAFSVGYFLAKFKNIDSVSSLGISSEIRLERVNSQGHIDDPVGIYDIDDQLPSRQILPITNLPRGSLDPLLASDAK